MESGTRERERGRNSVRRTLQNSTISDIQNLFSLPVIVHRFDRDLHHCATCFLTRNFVDNPHSAFPHLRLQEFSFAT